MSSINLEDYPKVDVNLIKFPKEIYIAFAVCRKECGNKEFIFDGETQVCEYCGHQMFRTEERKYLLIENQGSKPVRSLPSNKMVSICNDFNLDDYPNVVPHSILFPKQIYVTYVICKRDCGASGFIVEGQTDVCEYCGHHMLHTYTRKYALEKSKIKDKNIAAMPRPGFIPSTADIMTRRPGGSSMRTVPFRREPVSLAITCLPTAIIIR